MDAENPEKQKSALFALFNRIWTKKQRVSSEKELQDIINESEEQGIINEDEGDMLHSIFEFGDTIVREIMVPRTEMVSCSSGSSLREVLDTIIESGHSRVPFSKGTTIPLSVLSMPRTCYSTGGKILLQIKLKK